MPNCSESGNLSCHLIPFSFIPLEISVFISALNVLLSVTASLGNVLILLALSKGAYLHPPTKLMFRCLAVYDLCVGLVLQPCFVIIIIFENSLIQVPWKVISYFVELYMPITFLSCGLSVSTSTAISVDRLLALLLGLRYRHLVTLRRVRILVICLWIISASPGLIYHFYSPRAAFISVMVLLMLSVLISVFSYTKIVLKLRQHQAQVHGHTQQEQRDGRMNITRYKKIVYSIAWVQLSLAVCYVPVLISVSMIQINRWRGVSAATFWYSSVTLVFLNSSLNPFLYCWKITEVRQAVINTLREFCCSSG